MHYLKSPNFLKRSDICFLTQQKLSQHVSAVHNNEKSYSCQFCNKKLGLDFNLGSHINLCMTKSKTFHALFSKRNLQQNLTWKDTENLCIRTKKKTKLFVHITKNFKPIFISPYLALVSLSNLVLKPF